MELKDTIQMMISDDYRLRFRAEYKQLQIRIQKLERVIEKYNAKEPEFIPTCPERLLRSQLDTMKKYAFILETRACIENIANLEIPQEVAHNVLFDTEEMSELNAEQIKKALECCASEEPECHNCPYCRNKYFCDREQYKKEVLALITSQEQRMKELTYLHRMLSESYDHLEKTKDELLAERSRLIMENERLREQNHD